MGKTYFYHRFKVEMPILNGFYENFVAFMQSFCGQRDLKVEWVQNIECDGYTSVTFVLRGDYMLPSTLVSLGRLWQLEMHSLITK